MYPSLMLVAISSYFSAKEALGMPRLTPEIESNLSLKPQQKLDLESMISKDEGL